MREAYRINAVILLGRGYTAAEVADALLIDPDTARTYFKRYKRGGIEELLRMNHVGSEALLDEAQLSVLDARLQEHLHVRPIGGDWHWITIRDGCRLER